MSETATASPTNPTVLEPSSHSNHRGRGSGNRFRNPRPREGAQSQPASSSNTHRRDKPRAARADIIPPDGAGQTAAQRLDQGEGPGPASGESHQRRNNGRRDPGRAPQQRRSNPSLNTPNDRVEGETTDSAAQNDRPNTNSRPPRRKQFGSNLTSDAPAHSSRETSSTLKSRNDSSTDLTSRLIHAFTHRSDGLDCPICFVSIHPAQPTWSCSPSSENNTCCWTTFHLKCIRAWASKSTKETREVFMARDEDRDGEWRCPGCQTKRTIVPQSYQCFCGRLTDPKPGRLATPHSCGEGCSRTRDCEHSCPLPCHPGPCPPCVLVVQRQCYCGSTTQSLRCSQLKASLPPSLSCGSPCRKPLSCNKHQCQVECHEGPCPLCDKKDFVQCYCGKEEKFVACGEGVARECRVVEEEEEKSWEGRYECDALCERPFKCGVHTCQKQCHPPSITPPTCPFDPSVVLTCPCGKKLLETLPNGHRTSCSSPIPTCPSTCAKPLQSCTHPCASPCHTGPCPPCTLPISVPCRCGDTISYFPCSKRTEQLENGTGEVLCTKPCGAMRNCGRHVCNRVCCPLAGQQLLRKGKGKKRFDLAMLMDVEAEDVEGWHTCDLICNKKLSCGNHLCQEADHRGPCPTCLQSSFDELSCACGRTVLFPPIPCGTQIHCNYPCARPDPACGHPKTPHNCHQDGECPPCPFLTSKSCACGKSTISNVRCSQEKVSCGKACGKLLDCGFHHCDKLCHSGECGSCAQVCGKPRKFCLPSQHGCTERCHAPAACPETTPCPALITLTCACGRLQKTATCGACTANPASRGAQQLKCVQECFIAKRNANLAEALGIDPGKQRRDEVTYSTDLQAFFNANKAFAAQVEKSLNEFVTSDKKGMIFPHMPQLRRKFVHELAEVYRVDTRSVDQEPQRSVQIIRRIDSRIPTPLLSAAVTQSTPQPQINAIKKPPMANAWGMSRPAVSSPTPSIPTAPQPRQSPWLNLTASSSAPSSSRHPVDVPSRVIPELVPSSWEEDA